MTEALRFGDPTVQLSPNQRYPQSRTKEAVRLPIKLNDSEFLFTITLGSITEVGADAILCPSNPSFGLGFGAVEHAIAEEAGEQTFDIASSYVQRLGPIDDDRKTVPYAYAKAFPSGELTKRGIKRIIFSNVLPLGEELTPETVAQCVKNALREADNVGLESLAIPAIGTGFLNDVTFEESLEGTLIGMQEYLKSTGGKGKVKSLSFVLYCKPNEENAKEASDRLKEVVGRLP